MALLISRFMANAKMLITRVVGFDADANLCVKSASAATAEAHQPRWFGCQYMDICFYCYFLFSCVHNSLDFMKRIECGEYSQRTAKCEKRSSKFLYC